MKKIKYILISCLSIISISTIAQTSEFKKTEFNINAFYGLSGLTGSLSGGSITPKTGAQFSLEGSFFFTPAIGIGIGAGYADYSSTVKLDNYTSSVAATDDGGENLQYRTKANNVSEEDKLSAFEVPLFLTYRSKSGKVYYEGNAGIKASIPISSSYHYTGGTITTTGYYENYNVEFTDMPEHGFQTVTDPTYSGKLSTNTAFSAFAKVGVVIPAGNFGIHIGLYGSYGLNSILKSQSSVLVGYPNVNYPISSLSSKVSLISGGIRIGVSL